MKFERWQTHASYEEAVERKKDTWDLKYPNERIIMWDMTNVAVCGFSDTDLQRLTYTKYNNGNVSKGVVFTQRCDWLGTSALWPGSISDSVYNRREGCFQRQEEFA